MKNWKVALIGCGSIAEGVYLPKMTSIPRAQIVAVCDIIPERAKKYAERFNVPSWYTNIYEMLEKCDFDILMDTASIPAHHEINMAALKAGKHLYSQKPVGLTVEEVTEQINTAKASNVKFSASPIHMLRPEIQMAKQMIADGAIGSVSMVRCTTAHGGPEYFQFRDVDPTWFYRPGAGALYDLGVHGLHMVTGLLGPAKTVGCMAAISEPERTVRSGVFDGKKIRTDEMPDNYIITLDFGSGTIGVVDTGYCQKAGKTPSLEIYGTKGTISFLHSDNGTQVEVYVDCPDRGIRGWMKPMEYATPKREFFQCMCLKDLIEAIEEDRPVGIIPEHARHVVEIMCTIPKAIDTKVIQPLVTTF